MNTDLLLTVNSLLAGLTGILLAFVGFFLRDLHRKFSQLVERVNALYTELAQQSTTSRLMHERHGDELKVLADRVSRLEQTDPPR